MITRKFKPGDWGRRIKGEGTISEQVKNTMTIAKKRFLKDKKNEVLDASHFLQLKNPQLKLF